MFLVRLCSLGVKLTCQLKYIALFSELHIKATFLCVQSVYIVYRVCINGAPIGFLLFGKRTHTPSQWMVSAAFHHCRSKHGPTFQKTRLSIISV